MRNFAFIFFLIAFISCDEEHNTPTKAIDDDFEPDTAIKLKMGNFSGVSGHSVSGSASLYEVMGEITLLLEPFNSQNGPDLRVYLRKNATAGSYIDLGPLKSTTGKQSYKIPSNYDVNEYPYVLIWCQKFSVGFGRAETE